MHHILGKNHILHSNKYGNLSTVMLLVMAK
jgi:hypothetical protein